jgi:protein-disulfide isomerase
LANEIEAKLTLPVGDRDHILGSVNAPVTLVEYGDLECPYCRQVKPVIGELRSQLGKQVRYVFRHFPIKTSHRNAQLAAEATEAAAAQGKFWEMQEYLLDHQEKLDQSNLIDYARELDLDMFTPTKYRKISRAAYAAVSMVRHPFSSTAKDTMGHGI